MAARYECECMCASPVMDWLPVQGVIPLFAPPDPHNTGTKVRNGQENRGIIRCRKLQNRTSCAKLN